MLKRAKGATLAEIMATTGGSRILPAVSSASSAVEGIGDTRPTPTRYYEKLTTEVIDDVCRDSE